MRVKKAQDRWRNFQHQTGPSGAALRKCVGTLTKGSEPRDHKWSKGWWPQSRLRHNLGLQGSFSNYSKLQVLRAYRKLSKEDRLVWYTEMLVHNTTLETEKLSPQERARESMSVALFIPGYLASKGVAA